MPTPNSPVRPVPARPNLQMDRKRAKALLAAARRGQPDALQRLTAHHPRFADQTDPAALRQKVALHDAQLVVVREYGFASWPRWKQFVELRKLDRAGRAAALVTAACSNNIRKARVLLDSEPQLASFDLFTACACGDADAVGRFLSARPGAGHCQRRAAESRADPVRLLQPVSAPIRFAGMEFCARYVCCSIVAPTRRILLD